MKLKEVDTGFVFRLVKTSNEFPPDLTSPSAAHFNPSTRDVEHAKATGKPVLLSVWHRDRTTLRQARDIYRQEECVAFELNVADVRKIRHSERERPLRVFWDVFYSAISR